MIKKWWVRAVSILLVATLIAGTFAFLSFRVNVSPEDGYVSISLVQNVAYAATSFVRVTEGTSDTDTLTLNIQSSGTNRVFVVGLAYKSNSVLVPTSIVFNTTENFAVELSAADGGDAQAFLYYLVAPTVTTADVVITMPSAVRMVGYVSLFTDVDQTNPFTASTNETQGADASPTVTVSSSATEIVVDILAQVSAGPNTATAAWTPLANGAATGGGTDTRGAGQYVAGTGSRVMSYSMSSSDDWNIVAGALQPPSATPEISVSPTSYNFGAVQEGSTTNTTTSYFTITNTSSIQTDQTISVTTTTWSGVEGWLHNDSGIPGDNATAILSNNTTWGVTDIIVKNAAPNFIRENLPASTSYSFGLGLWAPTVLYDGSEKTITVRISAVQG